MKRKKEVQTEKGITLIALVITIIVLLILAGVSIAALGGQNGILTNATEAKKESEIGDVKDGARMDINEKQMEKLSPEITEEEFREILEKYGTIEGEGELLEQILVTENEYEIPVKEIWGGPLAKEGGNPGGEEPPTQPLYLQVGDYVRYNVTYTDVYTGYEFTGENGWRVLDPGSDNGDGTVTGLKLISTGIPSKLYYNYSSIRNKENNGEYGNWAGDTEQRERYANEYYASSSNDEYSMYAAAGLRYNFGKIKFSQGTSAAANEGYYTKVNGKTSGNLSETEFLTGGAEEVHNLTLAELNEARGESDLETTGSVSTNTGATGLFHLRGLNKYNYNSSSTSSYWLASPDPDTTYNLSNVSYSGDINGTSGTMFGVRPVVSLPSSFQVEETEG